MGKRQNKIKDQIKHLNQIIVKKDELIRTKGSSMDNQISPSSGWSNPTNGFGPASDPTFNTVYLPSYEFTYKELTDLYKNPLVRRVIKLNMDDSTRAGFELTSNNDAEKAVEIKKVMDDRFNWVALGRKMIGIKHNYGGGVLYADIDDGREPHEPLNEKAVKKVWSFTPVERFYAHPFTSEELEKTERPGEPMHYKITLVGFDKSKTFDCHESRLIRYPTYDSDDVLSSVERQRRRTWDIPTVQVVYDAIKRYGIGMQTGSSLLQGFIVDVFKVSNLKDIKDLDGFRQYVSNQWQLRNSMNAQVMGAEDKLERMSTPVTGMDEITKDQRRDVGMVTEIPVPVLFSEESGNLGGSTLDASNKTWFSKVASNQMNRDKPMYKRMLWMVSLEGAEFNEDDIEDINWSFNTLEFVTAKERAETEKIDAETAAIYVNEIDLPSKDVLDAKLTGGAIKLGALNYDPESFEQALKDKEAMESDQLEMESLLTQNEIKNTDPDRMEEPEKEPAKDKEDNTSKDESETFELVFT